MARGWQRRWAWRAGGLILVPIAIVAGASVYVRIQVDPFIAREPSQRVPTPVAIVLGASVYSSGRPSAVVEDRLSAALALYRQGRVRKLLVSGDHGHSSYDEVNAMAAWLTGAGVPARDVFLDHAGFRTYDTMARAARVFRVQSAFICTQAFHLPRAVFLARRAGIDAVGIEAVPHAYAHGRSGQNLIRESLATVVALGDVFVWNRQPRFLGPEIPIDGDGRVTLDRRP